MKAALPFADEEVDQVEILGGVGASIADGAELLGESAEAEAAEDEAELEEDDERPAARIAQRSVGDIIPRGEMIPVAEIPALVNTAKQRVSAIKSVAAAGMQALERLIAGLRPKILKEAKQLAAGPAYGRERVPTEDLAMEGVTGVIEAVDAYQPGHSSQKGFISFAVSYYMLPRMRAHLTVMTKPVTMPQRTATRFFKATRIAQEGAAAGEELTATQLADRAGMSERTLGLALNAAREGVSLSAPAGGDEESPDARTLLETLVAEDASSDGLAHQDLGSLLDQLDEVTRLVLEGYCGLYGEQYEDDYRRVAELVTEKTGTEISHTTAWRIYDEAIGALRKLLAQDLDADLRVGQQVLACLWPDERRAVLSYYGFYGVARAESFPAMSRMFREGSKQCSTKDAKVLFERAHQRLVTEFPDAAAQLRPVCERRIGRKLADGELNRLSVWRPIDDETLRTALRRSLQVELFEVVRAEIVNNRAAHEAMSLGISVEELQLRRESQLQQLSGGADRFQERPVQLSMF